MMSKHMGEQLSSTTVSEASTAVTSSTVDSTSAAKVGFVCARACVNLYMYRDIKSSFIIGLVTSASDILTQYEDVTFPAFI